LALVAAVREAMRLAHLEHEEIERFSDQALTAEGSQEMKKVCSRWVRLEASC
jgi:hypothetical protein